MCTNVPTTTTDSLRALAHDTVVRWDSCGEDLHLGAAVHHPDAGAASGNRLAFLDELRIRA